VSTYNDRQFELILDCTSFTNASEIPLQWVNYCAELIPMDIRTRLAKTHILNPNYQAQKYLRRLYNVAAGKKTALLLLITYLYTGASFCGEIRTYSTVDMLRQQVPDQALVPLAHTGKKTVTFLHNLLNWFSQIPLKRSIARASAIL